MAGRMLFLLGSRKWEPLPTSVSNPAPLVPRNNELMLEPHAAHLNGSEPRTVGFLAVDTWVQEEKRMPGAAARMSYSGAVT